MKTRIIMIGCNGRMGQVITNLVKDDKDAEIVAGVDRFDDGRNSYPVFESLGKCNVSADVIIDFSNPSGLSAMLSNAEERKLPIVLCTTGHSEEQLEQIHKASENIAILKSANMSLGINVLLKLLQPAAKILSKADYDIEIVEKHHNQKIDAPSGTALALADAMNEALDNTYTYQYDRHSIREKRKKNEIGIAAVRGGSIVGEHEVIFAGLDEVIEIKHTAYSRAIFAKGAIAAAKYLSGKNAGMYDMQNVIE